MKIYNTLEDIRNASGNDKIYFLSANPDLKEILEWAYNPFKKYYVTVSPDEIVSRECETGYTIHYEDGRLEGNAKVILTELNKRSLSGHRAKEVISDYMSQLAKSQSELFAMIINKDLKLGLGVKTINKAFPGLIPLSQDGDINIPIMLLKTYDEKKASFPVLAAPKIDGVRGRFKNGYLYSRSKKRFIGLDHIEDALEKFGEEFDGEIFVDGSIFDNASGLIRNKQPVPEATYYVFDMPSLPGNKQKRLRTMEQILEDAPLCIKIVKHTWIDYQLDLLRYYEKKLSAGYEGIVIYDADSLYEDRRSYDWMRLVPLKTADCKCTGVFEGRGKYENCAGGIYVNFDGKEIKVGTGFSDEDRKKFWADPNHYIGLICEIEYKERTKYGSLRQPRFKGWRLDKGEENFD